MWNIQYSLKYKYLDYDIEYGKIPNDATHCRNFEIISIDRSVYSQYVNVIELLVMYLVYHFCIIKRTLYTVSSQRWARTAFFTGFQNFEVILATPSPFLHHPPSLFLSASLSLAQLCFARLWKQWTSRVVLWLCIGQNNTLLYNTDTMGNGGTKLKDLASSFLCHHYVIIILYYYIIIHLFLLCLLSGRDKEM